MPSPRADEEFVERHWRLALWVARRRAAQAGWRGDPGEVESDAVLGLWNAARTFVPGDSSASWVRVHVDRAITDGLRARYGDVRYAGKASLSAATQSMGLGVADEMPDQNDYAVQAVDRVDVARALVHLTPRHRYVVVARYRDGLTWRAIGEHLGVTEGRAHQLGTEARLRLTRALTVTNDTGPHLRLVRGGGRSCVRLVSVVVELPVRSGDAGPGEVGVHVGPQSLSNDDGAVRRSDGQPASPQHALTLHPPAGVHLARSFLACSRGGLRCGMCPPSKGHRLLSHPGRVVGMFEGHPDDLWDGHDWDVWWAWLTLQERTQLLDLAWGEEPAPLLGQKVTMLRGATYEVVGETLQNRRRHTFTRDFATDELLVFLEEKRAGRDPA